MWAHGCEGNHKSCGICGQTVCFYHGHSNDGGVKGGHSNCRGKCSTSAAFRINCEGHMTQCLICKDWYCHYHGTGVAAGTLTGGHVCDVSPQQPGVAVTETCLALAELSNLVYYAENLNNPSGEAATVYNNVRNSKTLLFFCPFISNLAFHLAAYGYTLVAGSVHTAGTCHMAVFQNGSKKVLAIKGTSMNSHDIEQDIRMVLGGGQSAAATTATINKAKEMIRTYGVNLITGHSLGGYYAEIIATQNRICGIAFCAPGTNGPNVKLGGVVTRGFHNINAETDPIGNVFVGVYQHVQWSIYAGFTGHGIGDMITYLKQGNRPTLTNMNVQSRSTGRPTGWYNPN